MADINPFEDPDANEQSPLAKHHNDDEVQIDMAQISKNKEKAGQAIDAVKDDFKQETAQQKDVNKAPPPPSYCVNLFNWFPIRLFAFFGGLGLILCTIMDFLFTVPSFIQFFIYILLILSGIIMMFIESPTFKLTRWCQLKLFFWFRILSRMWGRAWFYLFMSFLCFSGAEYEDMGEFTFIAGIYVIVIALLSFIFSKMSATKYKRLYIFIAAGTEGDELNSLFIKKFKSLDLDSDGRIGSVELNECAVQSGRSLSNSETYAIQTFLDESCNGYISKEDWMKQFTKYNMKQHFL
eukprot:37327_1